MRWGLYTLENDVLGAESPTFSVMTSYVMEAAAKVLCRLPKALEPYRY